MLRRNILRFIAGAAVTSAVTRREALAQQRTAQATRGMKSPVIRDVKAIGVQPGGVRLIVVKITTDQDGLYGYGCAKFTQRGSWSRPRWISI